MKKNAVTSRIKVLVTGEPGLMREGIHSSLGAYEDIEVIGEATDGEQSVEKAHNLEPDIVVMGTTVGLINGFEATRRLSKQTLKTKVIILTDRDTRDNIVRAFMVGAHGCITQTVTSTDLASAIRAVHAGQWYLHPSLTKTLVQAYLSLRKIKELGDPYDELTERERQVLRLLAEGQTGTKVAESLGVAVKTALGHTANIMKKLDIHNRAELVRYVIRRDIIDLEPTE